MLIAAWCFRSCGSAGQRREGRARVARNARRPTLLPQAQGGEEMVWMVLLLHRLDTSLHVIPQEVSCSPLL